MQGSTTEMAGAVCPRSAEALAWLARYREQVEFSVERIPFADSAQWLFDDDRSALAHRSGKFFTIRGYRGFGESLPDVFQPLIDQPETGTQGFIVRRRGADLEILVQARTEPGNIGGVQIGPTIQATYSNYTAVHRGRKQPFLDFFHNPLQHNAGVVLDTVQPELGSKFLKKWNRNIIIEMPAVWEFPHPMFHWIPAQSLSRLMEREHIVNNDARLVMGLLLLECGPELFTDRHSLMGQSIWRSFAAHKSRSFANSREAQSWLENARPRLAMTAEVLPLSDLPGWIIEPNEIRREDGSLFSVIQVAVRAGDREVTRWDQPLIASGHSAKTILLCAEWDGVLNLVLRAKTEIGNASGAELHPTASFDNEGEEEIPPVVSRMLDEDRILDRNTFVASDEGGRFFQYVSEFDIRLVDAGELDQLPDDYRCVSLGQLRELIHQKDFVSDELRSIVSLLLASAFGSSDG